jgi:lipoyl synthase
MSENRLAKPSWLKVRAPGGSTYLEIKEMMRERKLATVCEEARCPNIGECWGGGTATIMVMGDTCTRACRFCNVKTAKRPAPLDPQEPTNVAQSLKDMALGYVVITMVNRDDLEDQGVSHLKEILSSVKEVNPALRLETLVGDFRGQKTLVADLLSTGAIDVYAHNIETVSRLTPQVRDRRATYEQSLGILRAVKSIDSEMVTKTSIMLGLGETESEVIQAMKDCRDAGVDIFTLGQYLQPSSWHLPVQEFVSPEQFRRYQNLGMELGFRFVASGPLVRSSYKAGEVFIEAFLKERQLAKG